ncbi:MAG: SDR family oxidoreductase [Lachnospiraceae bacterium]
MMTKALANDWGKYDITVNCIAPGYFPSELTAPYIDSEAFTQLHRDRCPKGRHGETGEMDGLRVCSTALKSCFYTTAQIRGRGRQLGPAPERALSRERR